MLSKLPGMDCLFANTWFDGHYLKAIDLSSFKMKTIKKCPSGIIYDMKGEVVPPINSFPSALGPEHIIIGNEVIHAKTGQCIRSITGYDTKSQKVYFIASKGNDFYTTNWHRISKFTFSH